MNIIIDLIGASLIGGIIVLLVLNINIYSTKTKFSSDSELKLQQNAKTLAEIVNYDLRKIGYNYDGTAIITAETNKVTFYSDIDRNGSVDIISLMIGDTTEVSYSANPRDRVLYRVVNGDTSKGPSLGLTDLVFTYRDGSGSVTSALDSIKYIELEMWIETTEPIDGKYSFTYWEMKINPRNI
jgi:hypothetical protein